MTKSENPFDDIPGTIHFNGDQARQGYQLNMFCMSLLKADNRQAFLADQAAYLAKFPMKEAQREAVLKRDWKGLLELGGNIFCIGKLAMCDGIAFQHVQATMSGMTDKDYEQMMLDGGRSIKGVRSKKEQTLG